MVFDPELEVVWLGAFIQDDTDGYEEVRADLTPEIGPEARARIWINGKETEASKKTLPARREIIAKLREAETLLGEGMKAPEVVKQFGIHEVPCYCRESPPVLTIEG